jgi:hypothetical protein
MADRFFTVVLRNPTEEEVYELVYHPKISSSSWSHAMDERDDYRYQLQKLLNEPQEQISEEENERRFKECMEWVNNLQPGDITKLMGEEFMEEFRRVSQ